MIARSVGIQHQDWATPYGPARIGAERFRQQTRGLQWDNLSRCVCLASHLRWGYDVVGLFQGQ